MSRAILGELVVKTAETACKIRRYKNLLGYRYIIVSLKKFNDGDVFTSQNATHIIYLFCKIAESFKHGVDEKMECKAKLAQKKM